MSKRKTHDEFIVEMKTKHPNIDVLGKYETSKSKILCKCKIDGYEWTPVAYSLSMGNGCPKCAGNAPKTNDDFLSEMNNINPNIEILEKYISNTKKVLCKCKIDNHQWSATPTNLLKGKGCPICSGNMKMSHNDFQLKLKEIQPNILLLSEYINNKTKVRCKCLIDEYEWEAYPNNLLRGCGCHKCVNKTRRTHEDFCKEIKEIHPKIKVLGKFATVNSPIRCFCSECENEFESLPTNLLNGHGCLACSYRNKTIRINNLKEEMRAWTVEWKKKSAEKWNYKCVITGKRFSHIHHLVTFDSIVRETFDFLGLDIKHSTLDYKTTEVEKIKEHLINLHYQYGYGIPLISELHCLFHKLYGNNNCTKNDMYNFINRIIDHEFDDYLKENNIELNIHKDLLEYLK